MLLQKTPTLQQPKISYLIRELRKLMQLTQEQFAAQLGVTCGTVNRWENGRMQPSPLALHQIERVLRELSTSSVAECHEASNQLLTEYFTSA